jgi:threonine dehydrogenase-like Zn-dependent dehydrogenase
MPQGLYIDKPESIRMKEYQDPDLRENEVRIRAEFAAVKHGTEFHLLSGQSPFQQNYFDGELRLFVRKSGPTAEEPGQQPAGRFAGNMVVGIVTDIGCSVSTVRAGERVFCHAPACETLTKPATEVEPLIEPMSETDAVCLDPALVAYTALRDARVSPGDNVVVFGLGAIGLFVVQLLRLNGCLHIIAVDTLEKRRKLAATFGADLLLDPTQCDAGMEIHRYLGQGADIAIEASGSYKALHSAMRSVQKCARIVTLGYYKGKDTELELGAEWFHNRLELICSMPDWGNPLREYPLWDQPRLWKTLITFFQQQRLTSRGIIDPIVPFRDAAQAYLHIYRNPQEAVKLGIRF